MSYMGVPLQDTDGSILGHMAVIDRRPIPEEPRVHAIFQIFAARAAAELQRLRAEADVREREEKVGRLLSSAMDAIIELDDRLHITRVNPAAEKVFRCPADKMVGQDFRRFVSREDAEPAPDLDRRAGRAPGRSAVALDSRRAHRPLSRRRLVSRRGDDLPISSSIAGSTRP